MRICENGIYRDATPEEIELYSKEEFEQVESNPEERIEQIEAALIELAAMVAGGV